MSKKLFKKRTVLLLVSIFFVLSAEGNVLAATIPLKPVKTYNYRENNTMLGWPEFLKIGNLIYFMGYFDGVQDKTVIRVFDVSNPRNPVLKSTYNFSPYNQYFIRGNHLYAFVPGTDTKAAKIEVYNFSNLVAPFARYTFDLGYNIKTSIDDIFAQGDYLYLTNPNNETFYIFQKKSSANSTSLTLLSTLDFPGNVPRKIHVQGSKYAFVHYTRSQESSDPDKAKLRIINIENPSNPIPISSYKSPIENISDFFVQGNFVMVETFNHKTVANYLEIVNVSDVSYPKLVETKRLKEGGMKRGFLSVGNNLFISTVAVPGSDNYPRGFIEGFDLTALPSLKNVTSISYNDESMITISDAASSHVFIPTKDYAYIFYPVLSYHNARLDVYDISPYVPKILTNAKLKGHILIQVESKGEAWYVDPSEQKRYFLGNPSDALQVIRKRGTGITNANLAKIPKKGESKVGDTALRKRLAGKILLQVESKGEAWYVDPVDLKRYSLGNPKEAFQLMQQRGLGISNSNLSKILVSPKSELPS